MLTRKDILNATYFESIYQRGMKLAQSGSVRHLAWNPQDRTIRADVSEGRDFHPSASLNAEERLSSIVCDCPSYQPRYGICEHLAAMLLIFLETWYPEEGQPKLLRTKTGDMLAAVENRTVIPVAPAFVAAARRISSMPDEDALARDGEEDASEDLAEEPVAFDGIGALAAVESASRASGSRTDDGTGASEQGIRSFDESGTTSAANPSVSVRTARRTRPSSEAEAAPLPLSASASRLMSGFTAERPPIPDSSASAAEGDQEDESTEAFASSHAARLVPKLHAGPRNGSGLSVSFRIGVPGAMYVLKDPGAFADAVLSHRPLVFGRRFTFVPGRTRFEEESEEYRDMIVDIVQDLRAYARRYNDPRMPGIDRMLPLPPSQLRRFMDVLEEQAVGSGEAGIEVEWGTGTAHLQLHGSRLMSPFRLETVPGGFRLAVTGGWSKMRLLAEDGTLVTDGRSLHRLDMEQAVAIRQVNAALALLPEEAPNEIQIPDRLAVSLFNQVVPTLEQQGLLALDAGLESRVCRDSLVVRLYLDRAGDRLDAWISFHYGEIASAMSPTALPLRTPDGRFLIRDIDGEGRVPEILIRFGFKAGPRGYSLEGEDAASDFVLEGLPQLLSLAEVHATEAFTGMRLRRSIRFSARLAFRDNGLLSFTLFPENAAPEDLVAILDAYRLRRKYARLKDGSFLPVAGSEVAGLSSMLDMLDLKPEGLAGRETLLSAWRAPWLDRIARETGLALTQGDSVRAMIRDISSPGEIPFQDPPGLQAVLRDYQRTGISWLATLARFGCGGILADDMGLGKTLQVLALILSERGAATAHQPSIVIAPTSLVYNWQEEAARFTPSLKVVVISGHAGERMLQRQEISDADLVVTSYALVRRDADSYADIRFRYCIADEAQHIKNPASVNARAVKSIEADVRFALTGTPIENSLTELWSIFDFAMPGYLHSHARFVRMFEAPVMKSGDAAAMNELKRHIAPFILRRMKKEVLTELPDKIETRMICDMTDEQRRLYAAHLIAARGEMDAAASGTGGFERNRLLILSLLTRLRQICCHPGVFIENYEGESGKLDALMEIAEDAVAGGHRLLLFSQFTRMLALIRPHLEARGLSCLYLDGSTPPAERLSLVKSFNAGTGNVFLISLKAGGSGLNLTGADTVVHFDPWWNPAVEDQATDRAYRMGQQSAVQVIRLVTAGTIEEKIDQLQRRKRDLTDQVIQPGETFLSRLSEQEIRELFS